MIPKSPTSNNKELSAKEKVLSDYLVRLGLKLPSKEEIDKEFNPTLDALNKKIKSLSTNLEQTNPLFSPSKITILARGLKGLAGDSDSTAKSILSLSDALGDKLGLGKSWASNTANMLNYAMMSKNVKDANKELYESMGPLGKMLVNTLSGFTNNKNMFSKINGNDVTKPAEDKGKKTDPQVENTINSIEKLKDSLNETIERKNVLFSDAAKPGEAGGAGLSPEQLAASTNSMVKLDEATTATTESAVEGLADVAVEAAIATGGILLIVGAVVALGAAFYKAMSIVVSLRMEMKKFDEVFAGVGENSVQQMQKELFKVNEQMADLGLTMEKVNGVILASIQSGVSWARATSVNLNTTVQELSGAIGVQAGEVGSLFNELIKKLRLSDATLRASANALVTYKQNVQQFGDIGSISFDNFKEAIQSSSNALLIAQSNGDSFAKNMISDLTALTGIATTLGLNISELNGKFEESGSLITSATSGFRDLLVISGGANMNNLMTDQFNRTESMMKMASYLQELNKQFGGNINITAQVAAQTWGISKETSLQLLNITEKQKTQFREMKTLLSNLDEDNVSKSYKNVTGNLVDAWEKVKASVVNMFERAVGKSSGMARLQTAFSSIVSKLQDVINGPTAQKLFNFLTRLIDSPTNWLSNLVEKIDSILDTMMDSKGDFWDGVWKGVKVMFGGLIDLLMKAAMSIGKLIMQGMLQDAPPEMRYFFGVEGKEEFAQKSLGNGLTDNGGFGASQLTTVGQTLNNTIKALQDGIARDKDILDQYSSVHAQGTDLTYGKDKHGQERWMTVAERQYALQEDIAKKQKEKEDDQKKLAAETLKVQIEIRDGIRDLNGNKKQGGGVLSKVTNEAGKHPMLISLMTHII